ncbi:YybH family protein [candidate division CSSED10-310 bacterium]|uniref:YybH family protein n=1 Tax=candidate division CSSED10-310 bacterium TaxID=2855610 RepID=A0ABV6Z190_UNCC1
MPDEESSPKETIRRIVRRINDLWLSKRYDDIRESLSEHVVIAPPGFDGRLRGREVYVQSYRDYDHAATTHEFSPGEPEIDVMGDVAVAVCPFFVVYELEGNIYRENGQDTLVLSQSTGEWRVVWRTMHSEPAVDTS